MRAPPRLEVPLAGQSGRIERPWVDWLSSSLTDIDRAAADAAIERNIAVFPTRADAIASSTVAAMVMLRGYAADGDSPSALYRGTASEPAHPGKFQTAAGKWFELVADDAVHVQWLGAKCDSATNDDVAFRNALTVARTLRVNDVRVPAGAMILSGNTYLTSGVTIRGEDPNRTILIFNEGAVTPKITMNGAGGFTGGGLRDLTLWSNVGQNNGYGLWMQGDATFQPDEAIFENIKVTGAGTWDYPIFLNGELRTTGAIGLRAVSMQNVFVGQANQRAFYAKSVEWLRVRSIGLFGGTDQSIEITGTAAVRSSYCQFTELDCQDQIILSHAIGCNFFGYFNTESIGANVTKCAFFGTRAIGTRTGATATNLWYTA